MFLLRDGFHGPLLIIGGAEDKEGDCLILRRLIELSGGTGAKVAVITAATDEPAAAGREYVEVFRDLGARRVTVLDIPDRSAADLPSLAAGLLDATAVFFTGGDQLRITSCAGGTLFDRTIWDLHCRGTLIAGTSAGASVMSDTMIVAGDSDDAPKKCTTKMAPGLGLLKEVVIDQHFAQRGRVGRLLSALAQNPRVIGVGLDEDTAILVGNDLRFTVLGSQTVTVLDGSAIQYTNASESNPDDPLALSQVVMHILPSDYGYDLLGRQVLVPTSSRMMGVLHGTEEYQSF